MSNIFQSFMPFFSPVNLDKDRKKVYHNKNENKKETHPEEYTLRCQKKGEEQNDKGYEIENDPCLKLRDLHEFIASPIQKNFSMP